MRNAARTTARWSLIGAIVLVLLTGASLVYWQTQALRPDELLERNNDASTFL